MVNAHSKPHAKTSRLKSFTTALVLSLMCTTQAHAMDCETDPAKFAFSDATLTPFYFGTQAQVDSAYQALKDKIGPLDQYGKPTVFYSKGYSRLTQHTCSGDTCSVPDIGKGFSACSAGGMSAADTCYPLAVVHQNTLYCLLAPAAKKPAGAPAPAKP